MSATEAAKAPARCQRIGCDATFTDDNNPEGSCQYHPSDTILVQFGTRFAVLRTSICSPQGVCGKGLGKNFGPLNMGHRTSEQQKKKGQGYFAPKGGKPIFHDGMKEWSCCKQRSHDFSLFLAIPGCTTGKHTTEKPVTKAVSANRPKATPIQSSMQRVGVDVCQRCHQGFFCSDHGSEPKVQKPVATNDTNTEPVEKSSVPPPKKKIDINEQRVCKNKGCGKLYKEKDNHDSACEYHPGPAVFHDRMRGWKCCDVHVKEFDEFMEIPPCTKGWHNADAA